MGEGRTEGERMGWEQRKMHSSMQSIKKKFKKKEKF